MNITIESIKIGEKEILRNLCEKYEYEFTQYEDMDVNDLGLYGYKYIDHYWTEDNRYAYFIKVDNKLAGFVLIDDHRYIKNIETNYCIAEFFVMFKYKRKGIGTYALKYILNKHKGKWQIGYHPENESGKYFWNKTVMEFTQNKYELVKDNVDQIYDDGKMAEVLIFET